MVGCFLEYEGKFLLLYRQDGRPYPNTWGVPAGGVEEGETIREAMERELWEESGYRCRSDDLEFLQTLFIQFSDLDFIYHVFRLKLGKPHSVKLSLAEHKDFKWVTPEEALSMDLIEDQGECTKLVYKF